MRQERVNFFFRQQEIDFAFGIVQIPENPDRVHAGRHAGRLFAFRDIVVAKTTFFDNAFFIGLAHIVRTSGHAHFAADAFLGVDMNDAVRRFIGGLGRTDGLAGRIVAVHALHRKYFLPDFWVLSLFPEFEPVVKTIRRQLPLHLAGDATGAAAGALGGIDQHGIARHYSAPFRTLTMTS